MHKFPDQESTNISLEFNSGRALEKIYLQTAAISDPTDGPKISMMKSAQQSRNDSS